MAEIVKWGPAAVTYYRWLVFKGIIKPKDECKLAENNYVAVNNNEKIKLKKNVAPKKNFNGALFPEDKSSEESKKPSSTKKRKLLSDSASNDENAPIANSDKSLKGGCLM